MADYKTGTAAVVLDGEHLIIGSRGDIPAAALEVGLPRGERAARLYAAAAVAREEMRGLEETSLEYWRCHVRAELLQALGYRLWLAYMDAVAAALEGREP